MKISRLFLAFIFSAIFFCGEIKAQLPDSSTAEDPVWYYIQVVGSGDLADRVFTMEDGRIYGRPIVSTLNTYEVAKQLWRFERSLTTTSIINKATGKKMDVEYNTTLRKRVAIGSDEPSTLWRLLRNGNYYSISMLTEPSGGVAGNTLAYQSNNLASRNYTISFESSTLTSDANALFQFVKYSGGAPLQSDEDNEAWYFIKTAKTDNTDKCITASSSSSADIKFTIENTNKNNENQYWKFVRKTDSETEKYHIINKGTGHIISTEVILDKYFYAQYTDDLTKSNGWEFVSLASGQFELKGQTDTGVIRYLNASSSNEKSSVYTGNSLNTGFAWTFEWIEGEGVGISNPNLSEFYVYSENGQIFVVGADEYTVRNIYGSQVNKNAILPTGIYLVTVNGYTTKVLVK